MGSEKEDLLTGMETLRSALKQLEANNQDLQRQLASLDKELLAERAMKEQKIKVGGIRNKRDTLCIGQNFGKCWSGIC